MGVRILCTKDDLLKLKRIKPSKKSTSVVIRRRSTVAECTRQVTRPLKGSTRNGCFHNRSIHALGFINRRGCDTAYDVRLVQYLRLPLSRRRRVLMIVRRHCGGAFAKGRDLHGHLIPLIQNHQMSSAFS